MENMRKVLVTGGGAPGAPGLIKALTSDKNYLVSCDYREDTIGKLLANNYFTVPFGDSATFIPQLLSKCLEYKINTVLPITTRELLPLAQNKDLFKEKNIEVVISNPDSIELANHKGHLMQHLRKNGIHTANFHLANSVSEFKQASEKLGYPGKAFTFKPTISNGSRGFRIIDESIDKHHLLFNEKPSTTFITYEDTINVLSQKNFPELVVMEYLPGEEYSIDCLINKGEIQYIIPRKRTRMRAGISIEGEIVKHKEIITYCKSILGLIPFEGPIGIQVKMDRFNVPQILEINPRIQGTSVACVGAGANIAQLAIDGSSFKSFNEGVKWGTKFIRYYSEAFYF
jgi:carbamoyl-phosphate synthase large subunit